jgi:hypothetical protein
MKRTLLAAVAALALGGAAYADDQPQTVGKSRLEVAKELADDCRDDILYGLVPKGTHIGDCVTGRLRMLDNASARKLATIISNGNSNSL